MFFFLLTRTLDEVEKKKIGNPLFQLVVRSIAQCSRAVVDTMSGSPESGMMSVVRRRAMDQACKGTTKHRGQFSNSSKKRYISRFTNHCSLYLVFRI